MNNFIQIHLHLKAFLALVVIVIGASGCAGSSDNRTVASLTMAIAGVSIADGVDAGDSQEDIVRQFEDIVLAGGKYRILRSEELVKSLNATTPGSHEQIITNYASLGWLKGSNMRALFDAELPVDNVLIARLEKNEVRSGAPKTEAIQSSGGQVLRDRERVVLSTIREMRLQASLINLRTGKVTWSRTYRATPATESSYIHYTGKNFSGSLAATVANTMTNGLREPSGPTSPSNAFTLQSLMQEVAKNLPTR